MSIRHSRLWRPLAAGTVLIATIVFFVTYFVQHPSVRQQIERFSLGSLVVLMALYVGTVLALAMIFAATLRLCRLRLSVAESALLTAYSSVINFFGPLQSGPAFRAVYLKQRYQLRLKDYTLSTLVYYFFYGCFSGLFLLSGLLGWWLIVVAGAAVVAALWLRRRPRLQALDLHGWYLLALATLLQVSLVALIYTTELHQIAPATSFSQAIVYTGAANLAMFVSLTPGAIGFRESFLVFSQHLHHISNATIVAANIVDRALYITLVLMLGIFIFVSHAKQQLSAAAASKPQT